MSIAFNHVFHIYARKTPFEQIGLDDINLNLGDSTFIALVGHTGSGKSTLIQHMNGLLLPDQGKVIVDEYEIVPQKKKNKTIKKIRQKIGVVFQFPEYQLFEDTVIKDVAFGPLNFGIKSEEAKERAKNALLEVGIDESYFERSPFELSGGEKRRVAIAGIIALKPQILVLDEPTAGLDPHGSKMMMSLFKKIHDQGTTIIMVTHDMDLVLEYAEKVIVMKDGKIMKNTTPLELFSSEYYASFSLDYPRVFEFATLMKNKGFTLDLKKIYNIDTLAKEIKKGRRVQ